MKANTLSKSSVAILNSILYLSGIGLFIRSIGQNLFGSSGSIDAVFAMLLAAVSIFAQSWFNNRSFVTAILGIVSIIFVGIPLAFFFLSPFTEAIIQTIDPNSSLLLSGSLTGFWFLLVPIVVIEILTDQVIKYWLWGRLLAGISTSILLILAVELLTINIGQSSQLDIARSLFYAPAIWGIIVFSINFQQEIYNDT